MMYRKALLQQLSGSNVSSAKTSRNPGLDDHWKCITLRLFLTPSQDVIASITNSYWVTMASHYCWRKSKILAMTYKVLHVIWPWPASVAPSQATFISSHSGLDTLTLMLYLQYSPLFRDLNVHYTRNLVLRFLLFHLIWFTALLRISLYLTFWCEMLPCFKFIHLCFDCFIFSHIVIPSAEYGKGAKKHVSSGKLGVLCQTLFFCWFTFLNSSTFKYWI